MCIWYVPGSVTVALTIVLVHNKVKYFFVKGHIDKHGFPVPVWKDILLKVRRP